MAQKLGSDKGALNFGEFNYPVNGENLLASVDYDTIKLFSKGQSPQDVFWLPSTTSWYSAATQVLQVCQSNFDPFFFINTTDQPCLESLTLYCIRLNNFCDLQDLELSQCYDGVCLPSKPKIVLGTKASSSDSYIKNKAYGEFLHEVFNVSTADQESAAVAWVSNKE